MIGYVTLGSNRYDEALQFYDALFGSIGAGRTMEADDFVAWSCGPTAPASASARRLRSMVVAPGRRYRTRTAGPVLDRSPPRGRILNRPRGGPLQRAPTFRPFPRKTKHR